LGKLAPDMDKLNDKISLAAQIAKGMPVLVQLSHDRMAAIADLPNTIFLKPRIFPNIKYTATSQDFALHNLSMYYLRK
jgi:hypothetical protein